MENLELDETEMAEGIQDTVVINGSGDVVGLVLEVVNGISHGNADACLAYHGGVITSVTKGNGLADIKTVMTGNGYNTFSLICSVLRDISKLGMPATRDTMWQTGHQLLLVISREERRQL